jgi:hypothetical protein
MGLGQKKLSRASFIHTYLELVYNYKNKLKISLGLIRYPHPMGDLSEDTKRANLLKKLKINISIKYL